MRHLVLHKYSAPQEIQGAFQWKTEPPRGGSAKAQHAWLSGYLQVGATQAFMLDRLQRHVWGTDATGSTLRSRLASLRQAL